MKFRRCPLVYVTNGAEKWIEAYQLYKNRFLPGPGGWLQQTNKFVEVMLFLDKVNNINREVMKNG